MRETRRRAVALALFAVVMALLPLFVSTYVVSVLIVVLFAAYFGQAWNIVTGFAVFDAACAAALPTAMIATVVRRMNRRDIILVSFPVMSAGRAGHIAHRQLRASCRGL